MTKRILAACLMAAAAAALGSPIASADPAHLVPYLLGLIGRQPLEEPPVLP